MAIEIWKGRAGPPSPPTVFSRPGFAPAALPDPRIAAPSPSRSSRSSAVRPVAHRMGSDAPRALAIAPCETAKIQLCFHRRLWSRALTDANARHCPAAPRLTRWVRGISTWLEEELLPLWPIGCRKKCARSRNVRRWICASTRLKTERDAVVSALRADGFACDPLGDIPDGHPLRGRRASLTAHPLYDAGAFQRFRTCRHRRPSHCARPSPACGCWTSRLGQEASRWRWRLRCRTRARLSLAMFAALHCSNWSAVLFALAQQISAPISWANCRLGRSTWCCWMRPAAGRHLAAAAGIEMALDPRTAGSAHSATRYVAGPGGVRCAGPVGLCHLLNPAVREPGPGVSVPG